MCDCQITIMDCLLTDIYDLVPTKDTATESISCPLTPKSQSLISPLVFTKIFDDFTSARDQATDSYLSSLKSTLFGLIFPKCTI